jgi:tetratricopeptide (TPR) repeat protein
MHLYDCYRLLGIPRNASPEDVKAAYRRLARKYHPDMNQNDPQSVEKFRQIQEAYRLLKQAGFAPVPKESGQEETAQPQVKVAVKTKPPADPAPKPNKTIDPEQKLKHDLLKRVQELIRQKRYVATIPIVEGLRERYPNAPEVVHWQAIAYYRWGSELLLQGKHKEARVYLSKVLTTDPKNRELCFEAKRDLERLERMTS